MTWPVTNPGQIIRDLRKVNSAMTIDQLIAQLNGKTVEKLQRRNSNSKDLSELRSKDDLEEADETKISEIRDINRKIDAEIDQIQLRIAELKEEQSRDDAIDRLSKEVTSTVDKPAYDRVARVGTEARTYTPDTDRFGKNFLHDVMSEFQGDRSASERLHRHRQEENVERKGMAERAVATGAFTGLTVPQYLTAMYAPAVAGMRPFADIHSKHILPPDGMTLNISRITTASSAALQSSQNSAISETNMADTLLTLNVQTAAGQQTVSRQASERGTGIEDVILGDLFRRYQTTLDSTLINQATSGLTNVAQTVTYTDASPSVPNLYPWILNGTTDVETALLGQGRPDYAIMHPRRWGWIQSAVGSTWPAFGQPGINMYNMGTNNAGMYGSGSRGMLPNGLQVIVDNNVPTNLGGSTNQDEIYIVPSVECHLWEEPDQPIYIRAEQPSAANLGILMVVYGYFAYTYSRYTNGTAKLSGTGLVTPTF